MVSNELLLKIKKELTKTKSISYPTLQEIINTGDQELISALGSTDNMNRYIDRIFNEIKQELIGEFLTTFDYCNSSDCSSTDKGLRLTVHDDNNKMFRVRYTMFIENIYGNDIFTLCKDIAEGINESTATLYDLNEMGEKYYESILNGLNKTTKYKKY
ncbi:MAG: hypothetical protein ACRDD7_03615 [Peptostreptococcaceae bacterium]